MIIGLKAELEGEEIVDIEFEDLDEMGGEIAEYSLDGYKLDKIEFTATIETQEDISRLKTFLTIARTNIK